MSAVCCDIDDHLIATHYRGMVTKQISSFKDELCKTLYMISFVMRRYMEMKYSSTRFYTLQELMPVDPYFTETYSFEEFERAMEHSVVLGIFQDDNYRGFVRYRLWQGPR